MNFQILPKPQPNTHESGYTSDVVRCPQCGRPTNLLFKVWRADGFQTYIAACGLECAQASGYEVVQ